MLRLDPGERRISRARTFDVWEGGGEYNVARGLRRCFGQRAAVLTALVDNPVGRLVEDLMLGGGVDVSHVLWWQDDGAGRTARNGLNFTERGFGPRPALGCSDRGNTAISQLRPGDIDFEAILGRRTRLFHTGGTFAALGRDTSEVALEAMLCARRFGARTSYDLNYRPSLWQHFGGPKRAQEVNRRLVAVADVLFGNEEDFELALGFSAEAPSVAADELNPMAYAAMLREVAGAYPNLRILATSLRVAPSASENRWGGLVYDTDSDHIAFLPPEPVAILDRVGGGDSFASGLLFGLLEGQSLERALAYGVAHGALAMSTPGDASMVTRREVERRMTMPSARIER